METTIEAAPEITTTEQIEPVEKETPAVVDNQSEAEAAPVAKQIEQVRQTDQAEQATLKPWEPSDGHPNKNPAEPQRR